MIKDGKRETWIYLTIDWIIARPQSYRTESLLIFHWEPMGRNPIYRSSSVGYFYSQKTSSTVQHNVYCLHHHFRLSTPCSYCFFCFCFLSVCVFSNRLVVFLINNPMPWLWWRKRMLRGAALGRMKSARWGVAQLLSPVFDLDHFLFI